MVENHEEDKIKFYELRYKINRKKEECESLHLIIYSW